MRAGLARIELVHFNVLRQRQEEKAEGKGQEAEGKGRRQSPMICAHLQE
jgi:stalled ribosome alternative rescue factor ArfA